MPSTLHEALVSLFRDSPRLAPMLVARALGPLGIELPEDLDVQVTSAEFADIDPPEYRADVVLRCHDEKNAGNEKATREIFIVEVQLDIDSNKHFSWPQYVTAARSRFRSRATLVVAAVDQRVAAWCGQSIALDLAGNVFRPVVIGPGEIPVITDEDEARRWPELAVLSVIAHGHDPGSEHIAAAAYAACARLDNPRSRLYVDLIQSSLNEVARVALEAIMEKHHYTYQSDFARKYVAQGREQGYRAVLRTLLEKRFGELPEDAETKLEQADVDTLTAWAGKVLTATSLAEVFAPA